MGQYEAINARELPRWDVLVRISHWGIALAVVFNGLITDEGTQIHVWIGYGALALLLLRLLWGFIGPAAARFASFPPSLSAARTDVADIVAGRHHAHRSHNPLGALMAYALWGTLAVVSATGVAMVGSPFEPIKEHEHSLLVAPAQASEDEEYEGEGYGEGEGREGEEEEGEEVFEKIHEFAANLLLFLSALHIAGVGFESWRHKRNLAWEMVNGDRHQSNKG